MAEEAKTCDEWLQKKQNVMDSVALLEFYVKNFDKEEARKEQVEAWAEKLERFYDEFHQVAVKIEALSTEENPIDLKGERQKFDSRYYVLRAFYLKQIAKAASSSSSSRSPSLQPLNVRLPELNLPKFSGRLEDWCVFRDSFQSAIGSRSDIGPVEKLHYLKGLVQGEAARILDPIKVSEQGYKDAWRALTLRFENKRQLIKCHIRTLFDTPAMRQESAEDLLALVDRFEQQISVLKSLGEPADKWSSLLVYLLTVRLDSCTLRDWENHCAKLDADNIASVLGGTASTSSATDDSTSMPSYVQMVNFLQNYARVLHAVSPATFALSPRNKPKLPPKSAAFPVAAPPKIASSSTSSSSSVRKSEKPCEKCGQGHYLYHCPEFQKLDIAQRTDLVKQKNICLNCLRSSSHFARTCSSSRCRVCSRKHHTLLHTDSSDTKSTCSTQSEESTCCVAVEEMLPVSSNPAHSKSAPRIPAQQPCTPSTSIASSLRVHDISGNPQCALVSQSQAVIPGTVFLPTALVNIRSSRGRIVTARCLLDCASQRNFVSAGLCEKLQLPRTRLPQPITISGIGNTTTRVEHEVCVSVSSRISSFSVKCSMLILPSITVKLPQFSVDTRQWSIPQHVDLADPTFAVTSNIDMILGAAHFFRVLRYGRISLGNDLPLLQNTEFGWVVSGECMLENHDHEDPRDCQFSNPCTIDELVNRFWQLEEVQQSKGWSPFERYCEEHSVRHTVRNADGRYVVKLPKREELLPQLEDNWYNATRRFYSLERSLARDPEKHAMYQKFVHEYQALGHMRKIDPNERDSKPRYYLPHHAVIKMDSTTTKLRTVFDASCRSKSGLSLNDVLLAGPTVQDTLVTIVIRFRIFEFVVSADIEKMYRQVLVSEQDQPLTRIVWRDHPDLPLKIYQLLTVTYGTSCAPFLAIRVLQKLADDEEQRFPLAARALRRDFYVDNLLTGSNDTSSLAATCKQLIAMLASAGLPLRQWSSNNQTVLNAIPPELRETETLLDLDHEASVTTLGLRWEPATDFLSFKQPKWKEYSTLTKREILSQISSLFDPLGLIGPTISKAKILLQGLWKLHLDWDTPVPPAVVSEWQDIQQKFAGLVHLRIPRHVLSPGYARLEVHGFSDASEAAYGACLFLRSISSDGSCSVRLLMSKSKVAPVDTKSIPRLELCAAHLLAKLLVHAMDSVEISATVYLWTDSTIVLDWLAATPSSWKTFVANRVAEIQELTTHAVWSHVPSKNNPADLISRGMTLDELTAHSLWWHGPAWLEALDIPWPAKYATSKSTNLEAARLSPFPPSKMTRLLIWFSATQVSVHCFGSAPSFVGSAQHEHFEKELCQLSSTGKIDRKSKLRFLTPQLVDGVIRLGGRLHNASIPNDEKCPILLPAKHRLTDLIVTREHQKTLHAGPGLLLSSLRQKYWPLGGRNLVRRIVHRCVTCARARPNPLEQLMGQLPPIRVTQAYPFENVGIDLAGPLYVRPFTRSRNSPLAKVYIVVYVCLVTKAAHLDLVSDLTTEAFIASLRRFTGRRGKPARIYCNNATNFVGATRELKELRKLFLSQQHKEAVERECGDDGIQFHFIPPRSPSFGGIWEACVKSVKTLLRKILGNAHLTESELQTALVQVEAMLNSRPITPLPIGRPLNAVPDPDLQDIPENRLSRYQRVQQLVGHFWSRWHKEYLATLQIRYRWTEALDNLAVGSIVVLKEEKIPPLKWPLGRVISVHPGSDGRVRVATVRTSNGTTQRAVSKLCLLPVEVDPATVVIDAPHSPDLRRSRPVQHVAEGGRARQFRAPDRAEGSSEQQQFFPAYGDDRE
ncbi:uncharacterized protein LOC134290149 [Aedes albopictus]|uniref:Integrase catalytic domain-containing protein n=1 Tax=Aedes albopictus TaxID=7160 RepID=A0ABM1Y765_AEDAL